MGREPIRKIEVEVRGKRLKNGKMAGKDEVTAERIKRGGESVIDIGLDNV